MCHAFSNLFYVTTYVYAVVLFPFKEGVFVFLSKPATPDFWRHTRNMKETPEEPSVY